MENIQNTLIDEKEIFVNEIVIMHNPDNFFLDLKTTSPKKDGQASRLTTRHNMVIINPYLAKNLLGVLKDNIEKYESQYGVIEKSEAVKKAERLMKEQSAKKEESQGYFG